MLIVIQEESKKGMKAYGRLSLQFHVTVKENKANSCEKKHYSSVFKAIPVEGGIGSERTVDKG